MVACALRSKGYDPYVTMEDATLGNSSPVYRFSKRVEKKVEDHQDGITPKPFTCTLERVPTRIRKVKK